MYAKPYRTEMERSTTEKWVGRLEPVEGDLKHQELRRQY